MKTPPTKFTAWSLSRLTDYSRCPRYAQFKHLQKLPEPPSAAMARGAEVHLSLQRFVVEKLPRVPGKVKLPPEMVKRLRTLRALPNVGAERKWGFDRSWVPEPDWFSPTVRCRMVVDLIAETAPGSLLVVDYKTGQVRLEHRDLVQLYALGAACVFPESKSITVELWYVDLGETTAETFTRSAALLLKEPWSRRAQPLLADKKFAPRPGRYCGWCNYSAAKGGPCPY